jgi:lycopene cyclase domain-containing protein
MFGTHTYLIWLGLFIGLPLLGLGLRQGRVIWRQRRALAWTVVGSLAGGWLWDAAAVRVGLWYYNPDFLIGWWWAGLPLEEWLWIVGVTLLFGAITLLVIERTGVHVAGAQKDKA